MKRWQVVQFALIPEWGIVTIENADSALPTTSPRTFTYFRGARPSLTASSDEPGWDEAMRAVRKDVSDALSSKHVSFLMGSGVSSLRSEDGTELGIATMAPLAIEFLDSQDPTGLSENEIAVLVGELGIDVADTQYVHNLESLMEVLYGARFVLVRSKRSSDAQTLATVDQAISKIKRFIKQKCTVGNFTEGDESVSSLYTQFYLNLIQRDRSLMRPWIFTTNYDLFNETCLDRSGIPFINGFMGSVERRFNPALFRYAIAENLDVSSRKLMPVDSLIYLVKLHGSVSWEARDDGLFPIVETHPAQVSHEQFLIYPTPAKQNASFASPYSDMFREFQSRVVREQSALFVLGYGFGDEHVNNIIFQALTIPTFRLIIFGDPSNAVISRLQALDDPRIWIVGTQDPTATWRAHFFVNFVHEFMAFEGEDPADLAIANVLKNLIIPERSGSL